MEILFQVLSSIYTPPYQHTPSSISSFLLELSKDFIVYTQNIHFFWYGQINIKFIENYSTLWKLVSFTFLDQLFETLGLLEEYLATLLLFMVLLFMLALLAFLLIICNKRLNKQSAFVLRFLMEICCNVFFIPIVSALVKMIGEQNQLSLSAQNYELNRANLFESRASRVIGLVCLIWVIFLSFLYEVSKFDMRGMGQDKLGNGKISANCDLLIKGVQVLNCLLYGFLHVSAYKFFLIVCIACYSISAWKIMTSLPYYSEIINMYKAYFQLSLACVGLFFLIGKLQDNANIIISLSILIQPVLTIIVYSLVMSIYNKNSKTLFIEGADFAIFELLHRKSLHSQSDIDLLQNLDKNYSLTKENLNRVVTAYYCLYYLDNCSLALIKINSLTIEGYNFPLNYQIYKCKLLIKNQCKLKSNTYNYLKYINKITNIRKIDKKFCYTYDNFFANVLENKSKLQVLKKSIENLTKTMEKLQFMYKVALIEFPNSKELKEMFSTFVFDLKSISEKENELRNGGLRQNTINSHMINTFIKDQTLFLVSADSHSFGKITFASKEFQGFIQVTQEALKDLTIWSIFPSATCRIYEDSMKSFISKSKDIVLHQKTEIYINDSQGFIHECFAEVYCTAKNGSVYFIFIISYPENEKELAIVSDQGYIYDHSKKFPEMLKVDKKKKIVNRFLNDFYPDVNFEIMKKYKYDEIYIGDDQNNMTMIQLYLRKVEIMNKEIHVLYLLKDVTACGWDEGKTEFFTISKPSQPPEKTPIYLQIPSLFQNQSKSKENVSLTLQNLNKLEQKSKRNSIFIIKSTTLILFILVIHI